MKARNISARYDVASTMRVTPASRARVIWCTVNGTPATGSMGLGVLMVSGRRRVPCPPTSSTASVTAQGCHTPAAAASLRCGRDRRVDAAASDAAASGAGGPFVTFVDGGSGRAHRAVGGVAGERGRQDRERTARRVRPRPGRRVGLRLPLHWQRSAWCAGAWTAGCLVAPGRRRRATCVVTTAGEAPALVGARGPARGRLAAPVRPARRRSAPAGRRRRHPRRAAAARRLPLRPAHGRPCPPCGRRRSCWTSPPCSTSPVARGARWGLEPGGRLLVRDTVGTDDGWLAALAVPLACRASVVLVHGCGRRRPDRRRRSASPQWPT